MPSPEKNTAARCGSIAFATIGASLVLVAIATAANHHRPTPRGTDLSQASSVRCGTFEVRARVGGRAQCLRDLQRCTHRSEKEYQRYGFHCRAGYLVATWRRLERPLRLPGHNQSDPCPISQVDADVDFAKYGAGRGIGPGPVYPAPFDPIHGSPINSFAVPASWEGGKEAIVMLPSYRGPVLIRGGELGAQGAAITFASNEIPGAPRLPNKGEKLRIPAPRAGSLTHTFFFLDPPGCFAYQIDGTTFSITVLFEVTMAGG
jgi:hypothetical protein